MNVEQDGSTLWDTLIRFADLLTYCIKMMSDKRTHRTDQKINPPSPFCSPAILTSTPIHNHIRCLKVPNLVTLTYTFFDLSWWKYTEINRQPDMWRPRIPRHYLSFVSSDLRADRGGNIKYRRDVYPVWVILWTLGMLTKLWLYILLIYVYLSSVQVKSII